MIIPTIPNNKNSYLITDYIELLCLANRDGEIDSRSIASRLYPERRQKDLVSTDEADEEDDNALSASEQNDRTEHKVTEWFNNLNARQALYKEFYPFRIEGKSIVRIKKLNAKHKLYVFFLVCASQAAIQHETDKGHSTTDFEFVALKALRAYLPNFLVEPFGKSRRATKFSGTLYNKTMQLAAKLHELFVAKPSSFRKRNSGDGGLDIVVYGRLRQDIAPGSLICFCQCACGADNWSDKQYESHYIRWKNKINFVCPPTNILVIPFSFRDCSGNWETPDDISECVLMDRYRLCSLVKSYSTHELKSFHLVNKLVDYKPRRRSKHG